MKPEDHRSERSPSSAPGDTAPHPAEVSLWEQLLARENLAEALRRVEQNAGAPGIDGMSTKVAADFQLLAASVNLARLGMLGLTRQPGGWARSIS